MDGTLIVVAAISAIPGTLMALLTLIQSRKNHSLVNSRMTELLKATKGEATAEGREIGRAENVK